MLAGLSRPAWIKLSFAGFIVAAAVHLALIHAVPYYVTWSMLAARGPERNQFKSAGIKHAPNDKVPYSNSYNLSSFMVYDLSAGPVRIHAQAPGEVPYWSLAVHTYNTDLLFIVNDRQLVNQRVTLTIIRAGDPYQPKPDEQVVISPDPVGMVLIRTLLPGMDNAELVKRLLQQQKQTRVEIVSSDGDT